MNGVPPALIEAACAAVIDHAEELTALDCPVGDGDHGINLRRGCEAVLTDREAIAAKDFGDGLSHLGTLLLMKVGGAAGPLYGTVLLELGRRLPERPRNAAALAAGLSAAVAAAAARGRAEPGQKTMIDVLQPVAEAVAQGAGPEAVAAVAAAAAQATVPMRARRGRAAFLGERSIGHMDPGARSAALVVGALCGCLADAPEEARP